MPHMTGTDVMDEGPLGIAKGVHFPEFGKENAGISLAVSGWRRRSFVRSSPHILHDLIRSIDDAPVHEPLQQLILHEHLHLDILRYQTTEIHGIHNTLNHRIVTNVHASERTELIHTHRAHDLLNDVLLVHASLVGLKHTSASGKSFLQSY